MVRKPRVCDPEVSFAGGNYGTPLGKIRHQREVGETPEVIVPRGFGEEDQASSVARRDCESEPRQSVEQRFIT